MINLLDFIYARNKRKMLSVSSYSIFLLAKSFLAEGVKVQFVLDFPPYRYDIFLVPHQAIAITIEKYM